MSDRRVSVYYIDNETFGNDFYERYTNSRIHSLDILNDSKGQPHPFMEAPVHIQLKNNISCDHGGLVLGSFLDIYGNEKPIDLFLAEKSHIKSMIEEQQEQDNLFSSLRDALNNNFQWGGFYAQVPSKERGFEVAKALLESDKAMDAIAQSYVWYQSEQGLIEEEIEHNSHFYLPLKNTPYTADIMPEIDKIEQTFPNGQKLVDLLKNFATVLREQESANAEKLNREGIFLSKPVQEQLDKIAYQYAYLKKNASLDSPLKIFAADCLLVIDNLRPTEKGNHLKCIDLTRQCRKNYMQEHSYEEVSRVIQAFDDKNIGVFTAESLRDKYHIFVHGTESDNPHIPLPRRDDGRVSLLEPDRTILFDNDLSRHPVPDSFHGLNKLDTSGRGGVSALIPKIAAMFALARSIDPDIRQEEFSQIILRSGDIALSKVPNETGDKIIQYGGIIPDKKRFEQNILNWKVYRNDVTPYKESSPAEKKARATRLDSFIKVLDNIPCRLTIYNRLDTGQYKSSTSKTTYGRYSKGMSCLSGLVHPQSTNR